jgi:hypothetical protein
LPLVKKYSADSFFAGGYLMSTLNFENQLDLKKLKYVILPGKVGSNSDCLRTHNLVFNFWENVWEETFSSTGAPKKHWKDHFLRQDMVCALMLGDEVVGCHLYTIYNLESSSTIKSEYFEYIAPETVQNMLQENINPMMSMEYLCVNKKFSVNTEKLGLGKLIISLGSFVSYSVGSKGAVGMPIDGRRVDKMAENVGAKVFQGGIEKYGYKLNFMVIPTHKITNSNDQLVAQYTDRLWTSRIDYSGLTTSNSIQQQKAA